MHWHSIKTGGERSKKQKGGGGKGGIHRRDEKYVTKGVPKTSKKTSSHSGGLGNPPNKFGRKFGMIMKKIGQVGKETGGGDFANIGDAQKELGRRRRSPKPSLQRGRMTLQFIRMGRGKEVGLGNQILWQKPNGGDAKAKNT